MTMTDRKPESDSMLAIDLGLELDEIDFADIIALQEAASANSDGESTKPITTSHRIFPNAKLHHPSRPENPFEFDQKFRKGIIASFNRSGLKVPIDFNHASRGGFFEATSFDAGAAGGWVTKLRDEGGDGLMGDIEWTDRGLNAIRSREYRYLSPEFSMKQFDKASGEVRNWPRLIAVALTNRPFLDKQKAIAATDTGPAGSQPQGDPMADPTNTPTPVSTAGDESTKLAERLADAERRALAAETSRAAAEQERETDRTALSDLNKTLKNEVIEAGVREGKITPAQKPEIETFAESVSVETLRKFVASQPVQTHDNPEGETPGAGNSDGGDGGDPEFSMSDDDRVVANILGLTEKDYRKWGGVRGFCNAQQEVTLMDDTKLSLADHVESVGMTE